MSSIIVLDSSDEDEAPPRKCKKLSSHTLAVRINSSTGSSIITATRYEKSSSKSVFTKRSQPNITPKKGHPKNSISCETSNDQESITNSIKSNTFRDVINSLKRDRKTNSPKNCGQQQQLCRKQSASTPPQDHSNLTKSPCSYLRSANSPSTTGTLLPTLLPVISSAHSLAVAGAVPPLQLLASTSPTLGLDIPSPRKNSLSSHTATTTTTNAFSTTEREMTAATQLTTQKNNINVNFKIHLPAKSFGTPSPPNISPPPSRSSKLLSPHSSRLISTSEGSDRVVKRIKPTTIIKPTDEAWLRKKDSQQNAIKKKSSSVVTLNDDINPEKTSTTCEYPKYRRISSSENVIKSQQLPVASVLPPAHKDVSSKTPILDLTQSSDKQNDTPFSTNSTTTNTATIIDVIKISPCNQKPAQLNGDVISKSTSMCDLTTKVKDAKEYIKQPLEPEYEELIKVCRDVEPSDDMEKLIRSKLIKYYYEVHPDFVRSKSFRKSIKRVIDIIRSEPDLVYYNLKTIVDELKVRRKTHPIIDVEEEQQQLKKTVTGEVKIDVIEKHVGENEESVKSKLTQNDEQPSSETINTGNKKTDEQIRKLNKALYILTKRIEALEQSEVEWDDEDSVYLQTERYKKRACQIYEKICDLTGESKSAHRMVKKPIKFNGTRVVQFNKTLQAFINRTKEFPDYYDVLRMLEYCNRTYDLGLVNFEIKNIAEDAFIKVGKLLQSRRKTEVYEVLNYFTENNKDPANCDPLLAAKLNENLQNQKKKIDDIIEKYVRRQEMPDAFNEGSKEEIDAEELPTCSQNVKILQDQDKKQQQLLELRQQSNNKSIQANGDINEKNKCKIDISNNQSIHTSEYEGDGEEYDDEDEEYDEEEDEDVNLEEHVESLANGEISDNESDTEIMLNDNSNNTINNVTEQIDNYENSNSIINTDKIISKTDITQYQQNVINTSDKILNNNTNNNNNNNVEKNIGSLKVYGEDCPKQLLPNDDCLITATNGMLKTKNTKEREGGTRNYDNANSITLTKTTTYSKIIDTNIVMTSTSTTTNDSSKFIAVPSLNTQQQQGEQKISDVRILSSSKEMPSSYRNKSSEEIIISDEDS